MIYKVDTGKLLSVVCQNSNLNFEENMQLRLISTTKILFIQVISNNIHQNGKQHFLYEAKSLMGFKFCKILHRVIPLGPFVKHYSRSSGPQLKVEATLTFDEIFRGPYIISGTLTQEPLRVRKSKSSLIPSGFYVLSKGQH